MSEKYSRQLTILPEGIRRHIKALVIGTGAVGKTVAETLAFNGIEHIDIVDFDDVEIHNCATQGFYPDQVGKPKVDCVAESLLRTNPELNLHVKNGKWRPNKKRDQDYTHVFSCVDVLSLRKRIHEWYRIKLDKKDKPVYLDARLGGEQIRIVNSFDEESDKHFPDTITSDSTAFSDGCHIPMVKHAANIAASMLVQQCIASVRGSEVFSDRTFALNSGELFDTCPVDDSKED